MGDVYDLPGLEDVIKVRVVNLVEEQYAATGAIVDTLFLERLSAVSRPEYFENFMARTVVDWCLEYFKSHKRAPREEIKEIFELKRQEVPGGEVNNVEKFLLKIEKDHLQRESFNTEFFWEKVVAYLQRRKKTLFAVKLGNLSQSGKDPEFDDALAEFRKMPDGISLRSNPWTAERLRRAFLPEYSRDVVLQLGGAVGSLVGPISRGNLVLFLGETGNGKTYWLLECAAQAAEQGKNVIFFDLDDCEQTIDQRYFKRAMGLPNRLVPLDFPVFDCARNQNQTLACRLKHRPAGDFLYADAGVDLGSIDLFHPGHPHQVCTHCRPSLEPDGDPFDGSIMDFETPYIPSLWKETVDYRTMRKGNLIPGRIFCKKGLEFIAEKNPSNLDIKSYAGRSVYDCIRHLEGLELQNQFAPDVVIVDYADDFKKNHRETEYRHRLNEIFETLKRLAVTRNCAVITASQINKNAWGVHRIRKAHVAEDSRKINHSDVVICINRTGSEAQQKIHRLSIEKVRNSPDRAGAEVLVLERRDIGLICHDSMLLARRSVDPAHFSDSDEEEEPPFEPGSTSLHAQADRRWQGLKPRAPITALGRKYHQRWTGEAPADEAKRLKQRRRDKKELGD